MAEQKVIILQDNENSISDIKSVITKREDFIVTDTSTDGEQGVKIALDKNPDILIVSIILKNLDGLAVLDRLKDKGLKSKIIVVSSFSRNDIIERALSSGAFYYMLKPFNEDMFIKRLYEAVENKQSEGKILEKKKNSLDERISKIFISVGIPPHIKGYYYLREGVKMAVENPDIINNITKQLYPKIGKRYSTTASKVERAIRHAIEVAWNRGRIETINSLLGIRAYVGNEKPTNGEFIALIADKMLLEGA
jgi:two-component system response regulator (stage 0 sporulation protein A)